MSSVSTSMSRKTFWARLITNQQSLAKQLAPFFPLQNKFYISNPQSLHFRNNTTLHKIIKFWKRKSGNRSLRRIQLSILMPS